MAESNEYNDLVVQINILKSLEVLEEKARQEWQQKWGFYLDFPKMILEEANKRGITEERYKELLNREKDKCAPYEETALVVVEPTDQVPKISSGFFGWRSDPKYTLEKLGPLYISPKHTLPYEPPYNSIFLG